VARASPLKQAEKHLESFVARRMPRISASGRETRSSKCSSAPQSRHRVRQTLCPQSSQARRLRQESYQLAALRATECARSNRRAQFPLEAAAGIFRLSSARSVATAVTAFRTDAARQARARNSRRAQSVADRQDGRALHARSRISRECLMPIFWLRAPETSMAPAAAARRAGAPRFRMPLFLRRFFQRGPR